MRVDFPTPVLNRSKVDIFVIKKEDNPVRFQKCFSTCLAEQDEVKKIIFWLLAWLRHRGLLNRSCRFSSFQKSHFLEFSSEVFFKQILKKLLFSYFKRRKFSEKVEFLFDFSVRY